MSEKKINSIEEAREALASIMTEELPYEKLVRLEQENARLKDRNAKLERVREAAEELRRSQDRYAFSGYSVKSFSKVEKATDILDRALEAARSGDE